MPIMLERVLASSILRSRIAISTFHRTASYIPASLLRRQATIGSSFAVPDPLSSSSSSVIKRHLHKSSDDDDDDDDSNDNKPKTALVLGSSGVLGSTVAHYLSRELGMCVIGADVCELPNETDWELDGFITVPRFEERPSIGEITKKLVQGVDAALGDEERLDVIICASGGWQGDPKPPKEDAALSDIEQAALEYADTVDKMMGMNLHPVVAAGFCAQQYMGKEGLFVVIGATAALQPTPGMLGYGLSKSAAHFFVQTLGAMTGKSAQTKAKRKQSRQLRLHAENLDTMSIVAILPSMIDTPANRSANPKGNFDEWIKPKDIAKEIGIWIETPPLRPHSGSLISVAIPPSEGAKVATFRVAR